MTWQEKLLRAIIGRVHDTAPDPVDASSVDPALDGGPWLAYNGEGEIIAKAKDLAGLNAELKTMSLGFSPMVVRMPQEAKPIFPTLKGQGWEILNRMAIRKYPHEIEAIQVGGSTQWYAFYSFEGQDLAFTSLFNSPEEAIHTLLSTRLDHGPTVGEYCGVTN